MQKLVEGIHHFQNNFFRTERELFQRLAVEQDPDALFITCSDSRISPELFTHTRPGDLFVLRNAGNLVPPFGSSNGGEAPTIEFAVAGLEVHDIIICGHSDCGAMKALLQPDKYEDLSSLAEWLEYAAATRLILREKYPDLDGQELLDAAVEENVLMQLENLRTHPTVAAKLATGQLKLHAWVYDIASGEVLVYNPHSGQFISSVDAQPGPAYAPQRVGGRSI